MDAAQSEEVNDECTISLRVHQEVSYYTVAGMPARVLTSRRLQLMEYRQKDRQHQLNRNKEHGKTYQQLHAPREKVLYRLEESPESIRQHSVVRESTEHATSTRVNITSPKKKLADR